MENETEKLKKKCCESNSQITALEIILKNLEKEIKETNKKEKIVLKKLQELEEEKEIEKEVKKREKEN